MVAKAAAPIKPVLEDALLVDGGRRSALIQSNRSQSNRPTPFSRFGK